MQSNLGKVRAINDEIIALAIEANRLVEEMADGFYHSDFRDVNTLKTIILPLLETGEIFKTIAYAECRNIREFLLADEQEVDDEPGLGQARSFSALS